MFKPVTKYQTADGRTFDSEQQAARYADELLCRKLDALLRHWLPDSPRHDLYKAVCAMSAERNLLLDQLKELVHVLGFGGDGS